MNLRKNIQLSQFEFHLEKTDRFACDSSQKLGFVEDILLHFEKHANTFVFKNGFFAR